MNRTEFAKLKKNIADTIDSMTDKQLDEIIIFGIQAGIIQDKRIPVEPPFVPKQENKAE